MAAIKCFEDISANVDVEWNNNAHPELKLDKDGNTIGSNIYTGTHYRLYSDSSDKYVYSYSNVDSQFIALAFRKQNISLKVNFNITPTNATNKKLAFTAHKVNPTADTSYSGSSGGWAGAATDEVNIDDYVTITQDGIITTKSGFPNDDIIRITATTTDGSNKSFSFDVINTY